jgi:hypothetical protein
MSFLRRNRQPIPELRIDASAVADETLDRSDAIRAEPTAGFVDEAAEMERLKVARWKERQGFQ